MGDTAEHILYNLVDCTTSCYGEVCFSKEDALKAMRLYANYKLELASEEASVDYGMVDKNSITDLKDKI